MELSVMERLMALGALPGEGDYATLKILNQLKLSLSFSEKEVADWGIVADMENNRTTWAKDEVAEIPIGEKATDIIVAAFKKLDREKKLSIEDMGAYDKFISN